MSAGAADVVVIGAGIVGTATAARLADRGASVVLVESEAVAAGASGRNSGVVQYPLDPVLADLHRETLRLYRDLEADGDDDFRLGDAPAGLLYVSTDDLAVRPLAAALAESHPELRPELVEDDDLQRLEPALARGLVACRLAIGYPVAPASATRAYALLAERRGVRVVVGDAARLAVEDDRVVGVTVRGRLVPAAAVVVAAGPWTPAIIDPRGVWQPIRALWGVVAQVSLDAPPRHVLEEAEIDTTIEPGGDAHKERGDDRGVSFSLVTAGELSAVGSTFLDDEPETAPWAARVVAHAARFVPAIATARVDATRRCARPLSFDGRPLVGAVPGVAGLFVAAGHGPWGISTGPASARLVADAALDPATEIPPALDPARYPVPPGAAPVPPS